MISLQFLNVCFLMKLNYLCVHTLLLSREEKLYNSKGYFIFHTIIFDMTFKFDIYSVKAWILLLSMLI